ncbi:tRNA (cytosine(34)-C(5))-methyltransferase-like protein, partial [Trifolium pratense]
MGRGRGGKSRTQRKHFQQNRENVWKPPRPESLPSPTNLFDIQNADFDHYYKDQNIVSPEEWDSFMQLLRTPLPAAFRINSRNKYNRMLT